MPLQASGSSSPCSHSPSAASRHPVSALKKWLTNPVRKLSSDARAGAGKVEKQMFRSDSRPPQSLLSHSEAQQRPLEPHDSYTILPSADTLVRLNNRRLHSFLLRKYVLVCNGCGVCVVQVWKDGLLSPAAPSPAEPPCPSCLSDLLQGRDTQTPVMSLLLYSTPVLFKGLSQQTAVVWKAVKLSEINRYLD